MKNIEFLDLVNIVVTRGIPTAIDPCPVIVSFDPIDKEKNIVFDEDALKTMNNKITERMIKMGLNVRDPNVFEYIKEFAGRLAAELYRNGLIEFEDVKDAPEDPYAKVRNKH
jgi:hypothetical protein